MFDFLAIKTGNFSKKKKKEMCSLAVLVGENFVYCIE
jgi:hypothetical protein